MLYILKTYFHYCLCFRTTDQTVTFEADDFQQAYDGIESLIGVARVGYYPILQKTIRDLENGGEINNMFWNKLAADWVAVESGQWQPPTPSEEEAERKYFCAQ